MSRVDIVMHERFGAMTDAKNIWSTSANERKS